MVVVEGVARSLDPHINIWQVARPVVEDYVRRNVGPQALLKDLVKTVQVLGRFGPKLPQIAEDLLTRGFQAPEAQPATESGRASAWLKAAALIALGAVLGLIAVG
jgi:ubiquinone biosynthesis protein